MAFTSKSVDKYSVLGMTVFEDNLFKIRITTPKSELNSHKYRVNKIIKSIGDYFFKNILTMHSMGNPGPACLEYSLKLEIISFLNVQWEPWFPMSATLYQRI